jgi:hypothetical protein
LLANAKANATGNATLQRCLSPHGLLQARGIIGRAIKAPDAESFVLSAAGRDFGSKTLQPIAQFLQRFSAGLRLRRTLTGLNRNL